MKLAWVVSAALCVLISTLAQVEAQNCGPRIRKDWDALTTAEKETYKGALAAAMDSGGYIKFIEMHTEMQSDMHAHRQCMFIYWHRLLLVVFENMLRAQGPQFACVTVPYYNWIEANDRGLAGTCTSIADCSSIATEIGGTSGQQRRVSVNGVNTSGRCANDAPLNHFCESETVTGSDCVRCVPRGNWNTATLPASTSFASVRQQLFGGQNIGQMSPLIERGCHNNMHSSLAGTVQTLASPSDPIFWSHHSMVDALHTIFHKCRVGSQRLTFEQKATHPVAWSSCTRRDGATFSPSDIIVMRTGLNGNNPIQGSEDPVIGQYFAGVPNQYAGLMDGRDLGSSSYSYELSGQLADMFVNCDGTSAPAPPAAEAAPVTTPIVPGSTTAPVAPSSPLPPAPANAPPAPVAPAPAPVPVQNAPRTPPAAPQRPNRRRSLDWLFNRRHRNDDRRLEAENPSSEVKGNNGHAECTDNREVEHDKVLPSTVAPAAPPTMTTPPAIVPLIEDSTKDIVEVVLVTKRSVEDQHVSTWYEKTTAAMGGHCPEVRADIERQACMFESQCLGGTPEYSAEFKATWGVDEPRCLTIVKEIESGQQTIAYGKWREDMESHFGCPKPANATQSISETDMYNSAVQSVNETNETDVHSSTVQSVNETNETDVHSSTVQSVNETNETDVHSSTVQSVNETNETDVHSSTVQSVNETNETDVYSSAVQSANETDVQSSAVQFVPDTLSSVVQSV